MKETLRLIGKIRHKVKASGVNCLAFMSNAEEQQSMEGVDDQRAFAVSLMNNMGSFRLEGGPADEKRVDIVRRAGSRWRASIVREHVAMQRVSMRLRFCLDTMTEAG